MEIKKFGAYPTTNPPSPASQTLPFGEMMRLVMPLLQSVTAHEAASATPAPKKEDSESSHVLGHSTPSDNSSSDTRYAYAHYLKRHEELRRRLRGKR